MGNIEQKLEYLKDTKEAIKTAIVGKGGSIAEDASFRSYAETITNLPSGGGEELEPIVLTGNCQYVCGGDVATWAIENYGHLISTNEISNITYMFQNFKGKTIPFEINTMSYGGYYETYNMFNECKNLETLPKFGTHTNITGNVSNTFKNCINLRYIPDTFFDNTNIGVEGEWEPTRAYGILSGCSSLRKAPMIIYNTIKKNIRATTGNCYFYSGFADCNSIDEIVDLPEPYNNEWTSNAFGDLVLRCHRLKRFTFALEDGKPYVRNWKSQMIDISNYIGFAYGTSYIVGYNNGITADKEVKDDATYQALKNDPDWFSCMGKYSRYNKTSAVETINSLPDTSAYLLANGGTNTIKFSGLYGIGTDGGAINTMTAEEIAVATAKGWTVSIV